MSVPTKDGKDPTPDPTRFAALADAMKASPSPGRLSAEVFSHGTMSVRFYAPKGEDLQTPHEQDEIYIVARGSGWFVNGPRRHRFGAGDALFVPAGVEHRFEDFDDDFGVWVVFYGPNGGE